MPKQSSWKEAYKTLSLEDLPPILTVSEVAAYLRIGRTMAYELARHKNFPAIRVGRSVRVPRDRFLEWVQRHTQDGEID